MTTGTASSSPSAFAYRGRAFLCSTVRTPEGMFRPVVTCVGSSLCADTMLPQDTEPYRTEAEALRHAEQQAERWADEQDRDGRGMH
jgi:hypothetical protein